MTFNQENASFWGSFDESIGNFFESVHENSDEIMQYLAGTAVLLIITAFVLSLFRRS